METYIIDADTVSLLKKLGRGKKVFLNATWMDSSNTLYIETTIAAVARVLKEYTSSSVRIDVRSNIVFVDQLKRYANAHLPTAL